MKKILYILLLLTFGCQAQRVIINQQNQSKQTINIEIPQDTLVNNQLGEIEYFDAYLLPLSEKANLQTALDTYGAVRLEQGDYSGVNVVMHSNQKLFGHPTANNISSITIADGSTGVVLESLRPAVDSSLPIVFESGESISNCTLKTMLYAEITAENASLNNNTFIDMQHTQITFDATVSGYFRNNRVIKHMKQGASDIINIRGNRTTPSYGNILLHTNFLGSSGNTSDFNNLESLTMIGTDAETYGGLTRELIHIENVDDVKFFIMNGGISYNSGFGFSSIDATNIYTVTNNGGSDQLSTLSPRTNMLNFVSDKDIQRSSGTVTGFYGKDYLSQIDRDLFPHFNYNSSDITATITDTTIKSTLINSILGTQFTPWDRPAWGAIPDPLGANWKADRVGKPDSTSYIQNLIDTNGIADLPEGVFYISSSLIMDIEAGEGIIGKGTGKTVICGLTDDFPLITIKADREVEYGQTQFGNVNLAYLTLQGGNSGIYVHTHEMMMSFQSLKYISFRNQQYGIHIYDIFGLDNCFFEYLSFINCGKGFYSTPWEGTLDNNYIVGATYLDKNVFYKCQFINCDTSIEAFALRATNLNAWVDCKFDGGLKAADMSGDTTIFANCDFNNFTGDYVMDSNSFNLINCNFYENAVTKSTMHSILNNIEGCNFLDNIPLGSPYVGNQVRNYIANSTVTGDALVLPSEEAYWPTYSTLVNNNLLSNPTLSKVLSKNERTSTTSTNLILIDETPNPYPQFLVTQ